MKGGGGQVKCDWKRLNETSSRSFLNRVRRFESFRGRKKHQLRGTDSRTIGQNCPSSCPSFVSRRVCSVCSVSEASDCRWGLSRANRRDGNWKRRRRTVSVDGFETSRSAVDLLSLCVPAKADLPHRRCPSLTAIRPQLSVLQIGTGNQNFLL